MKLLICFVNKKALLNKVTKALLDLRVGGVTILDSAGMGRSEAEDFELYEGFKNIFRLLQKDHYTVMCVMRSSKVNKVAKVLEKVYGGFKEKQVGFFFTVPVDKTWGLKVPK